MTRQLLIFPPFLHSMMAMNSNTPILQSMNVRILKATDPDVLRRIMGANGGGLDLMNAWLQTAVKAREYRLVSELADLLIVWSTAITTAL